ncbi:DUF393 domain-containing protein [Methylobacterium sp. 77]|uniref:thiol-disulfide oxidoreductase DCC family protein n=1 Tax=Methylobacterium sp. 77 TaxID=1101192 RepID=UPI000378261B|nr:DUF393 domain-containing protein [Methylobacterium sp. 77]
MTQPGVLTVYYDGACPLCAAEIRTYRRSRGSERLRFVDVSGDDAPDILGPDLTRAAARARFHVRDEHGRLASGAKGFIRLWRHLPGWRWLAIFASLPGMPILAEAAYRRFLPLRPSLARLFTRFRGRKGAPCDTACGSPKV